MYIIYMQALTLYFVSRNYFRESGPLLLDISPTTECESNVVEYLKQTKY